MRLLYLVGPLGAIALGAAVACSGPEEDDSGDQGGEAISGGQSDTQHGFAVGIQLTNGSVCSGVLIAPNLVMTAQHCVSPGVGGQQITCGQSGFSQRPVRTTDVT